MQKILLLLVTILFSNFFVLGKLRLLNFFVLLQILLIEVDSIILEIAYSLHLSKERLANRLESPTIHFDLVLLGSSWAVLFYAYSFGVFRY